MHVAQIQIQTTQGGATYNTRGNSSTTICLEKLEMPEAEAPEEKESLHFPFSFFYTELLETS